MDEEMKENWPKNDLLVHKDRAIALDRALKFAVLFRKENFPKIQGLISTKKIELTVNDFVEMHQVIHEAGISDKELEWAVNYLKHFNEFKYKDSLPASVPW